MVFKNESFVLTQNLRVLRKLFYQLSDTSSASTPPCVRIVAIHPVHFMIVLCNRTVPAGINISPLFWVEIHVKKNFQAKSVVLCFPSVIHKLYPGHDKHILTTVI